MIRLLDSKQPEAANVILIQQLRGYDGSGIEGKRGWPDQAIPYILAWSELKTKRCPGQFLVVANIIERES